MQRKIRSEPVSLDLARYELRRSGLRISIERIPMELLILLARSGGRLLTRHEIIDHLWGKNPWLDADRNLNTAIGKIRRALADDPERPRYIETAVGKGYRFIATVSCGMDSRRSASNGNAELVILDSSLAPLQNETIITPEIAAPPAPHQQTAPDSPKGKRKPSRAIVLSFLASGIFLTAVFWYGWNVLDRRGWIGHDRDTPVWIHGDWMVGEYRECQMTTPTAPQHLDSNSDLPSLYCGEDGNGYSEFQSVSASPQENQLSAIVEPVNPSVQDHEHRFHLMPVRYFGRRPQSPLTSWRCRRNNDSLLCRSLD